MHKNLLTAHWSKAQMKLVKRFTMLLLLCLFLASCDRNHIIENINCDDELVEQAKIDKEFLENVLNGYKSFIEHKNVHVVYRDSFLLSKHNISGEIIYSNHEGIFSYFTDDYENKIRIRYTQLPSQQYFFLGIHKNKKHLKHQNQFIDLYKNSSPFIKQQDSNSVYRISNLTIYTNYGRMLKCRTNGIFVLTRLTHKTQFTIENKPLTATINKVGFYIEENSFKNFIEKADSIGYHLAKEEYQHLFIKSEFFRKSILHNKLKEQALRMNEKYSKSQKVEDYDYPDWEFELDKNELIKEARKYSIDVTYVEMLALNKSNFPNDGILFIYYKNYFEFSLQWCIANIIFLILLLLLKNKILSLDTVWLKRFGPFAFLSFINAWIFTSKLPANMMMSQWIIPAIIAIIVIITAVLIFQKNTNHSNTAPNSKYNQAVGNRENEHKP